MANLYPEASSVQLIGRGCRSRQLRLQLQSAFHAAAQLPVSGNHSYAYPWVVAHANQSFRHAVSIQSGFSAGCPSRQAVGSRSDCRSTSQPDTQYQEQTHEFADVIPVTNSTILTDPSANITDYMSSEDWLNRQYTSPKITENFGNHGMINKIFVGLTVERDRSQTIKPVYSFALYRETAESSFQVRVALTSISGHWEL